MGSSSLGLLGADDVEGFGGGRAADVGDVAVGVDEADGGGLGPSAGVELDELVGAGPAAAGAAEAAAHAAAHAELVRAGGGAGVAAGLGPEHGRLRTALDERAVAGLDVGLHVDAVGQLEALAEIRAGLHE